jgi:hypothetical protein
VINGWLFTVEKGEGRKVIVKAWGGREFTFNSQDEAIGIMSNRT